MTTPSSECAGSWVGDGPPETCPLGPAILSSGGQLEGGHVFPRCPCKWTKPPECSFLVAKHSLQVPLAFLTLGPIWVRQADIVPRQADPTKGATVAASK